MQKVITSTFVLHKSINIILFIDYHTVQQQKTLSWLTYIKTQQLQTTVLVNQSSFCSHIARCHQWSTMNDSDLPYRRT